MTYAELDEAVAARLAHLDLPERSVVVLSGGNSVEWVVTYLALMSGGHVPLLASGDADRLVRCWEPAAHVSTDRDRWSIERFEVAAPDLHPELCLLMSTSGSTGSPKLVRLSRDNLDGNARSIASFQRLSESDRGITSLPLHYSFGLSILHSHLAVGASVVVTDGSVVDRCFSAAMREHGVTNFAGVPHTYELIDQVDPERIHVPSLRFLAHAGGRMGPDRVRAWADRASTWGVEWFSMYGQTEATARMAYVPPTGAAAHAGSIGIAIPGGELSIDPDVPAGGVRAGGETGVGEIVYRGPNVMLGYATQPADLARGRDIHELRTGDLGRIDPVTGMFEIVGRASRRVKPFGLRIDLDDVERRLAEIGIDAVVVGDDEGLVASAAGHDPSDVTGALARITGIPVTRLTASRDEAPRTANGKVDGVAMLTASRRARPDVEARDGGDDVTSRLAASYGAVLGRRDVDTTDSFVGLGGDSLSYVECSIRVEQILGHLPVDWHTSTIADLALTSRPRKFASVDTTVVLRAIGICLVVATHMRLRHIPGGAHLLLGVVGFNLARFMMSIEDVHLRLRAGLRTVARVALPTMAWAAVGPAIGADYGAGTVLLVNNYTGPSSHSGDHWHFWFIEVFTHLVLLTTLLFAVRPFRLAERRWPYVTPLVLLAATITLRFDWADLGDWYNMRFRTHAVAWFFVLGWLVHRSDTVGRKILTTVICIATAPGVFQNPQREFLIAGGLVLLLWAPRLTVPRQVVRPLAMVAAASMWILISHFTIWPPMKELFVVEVAYVATLAASIGVWWIADRAVPALWRHTRSLARPTLAGSAPAIGPAATSTLTA